MKIYVLCGLPASGKTTLSEELATQYEAKLFHYDDYKRHQKRKLYEQIKKELVSNNVVLDGMFVVRAWREELLKALEEVECEKILVKMDVSVEECVERNKEREHPLNKAVIVHETATPNDMTSPRYTINHKIIRRY